MRDDFDSVVADRFKVLDDVPVPDTWSRVLDRVPVSDAWSHVSFSDEGVTTVDLEAPVPTEPRRKGPMRLLVAGLVAAAAVVAIVLVVSRDGNDTVPADQPPPTVTVPPTAPPRALFGTPEGEQLVPGTYFVDEVDGTPTPRILVTVGAGWSNFIDRESIGKLGPTPTTYSPEDDVGFITFSRPDRVYLDACQWGRTPDERGRYSNLGPDEFYPGSVTTLDGLIAALTEQGGWVDVTAPSDISVDGYPGKTFQRTAPAEFSDCDRASGGMRLPELDDGGRFHSWRLEGALSFGGNYYEPGQIETLMVLDIDGTVVVISTNLWAGSSAADRAEFAAVLDSIRIDRG